MPRPDRSDERRRELVPVLARTFAELGYRRTTTAELGKRCGVRENVLYRLWPDKRAMFVAALDHVYERSEAIWKRLLAQTGGEQSAAERILAHEATHHGERGLYRIVFAGLSETDDPELAEALRRLFGRFQRFVEGQVRAHRGRGRDELPAPETAWAIVGLGTVANIGRELGLLSAAARARVVGGIGRALLGGRGRA